MIKRVVYFWVALVMAFVVNSCREDADWGNNNGGEFGFTVDRDKDFIEKSVGEKNNLKFNIVTKYVFSTIPIKFRYTTTLEGDLYLSGELLQANKEYEIKDPNNVFEYIGKESGNHQLKISVKNDKGASITEEFQLKYGISDFTVSSSQLSGAVYQGTQVHYILKVEPKKTTNNQDYEIRIDEFSSNPNSTIYMGSQEMQIGKYYPINPSELHNIKLIANFWDAGMRKIVYTIRNKTVIKSGLEILQEITPRKVNIVSIAPTSLKMPKNGVININAIVNKAPTKDTPTIYYKTWISSSKPNAITTTNNSWQPYSLGSNDEVKILNLKSNEFGTHTYNVQFKDEYENLSPVSTFDISVEEPLQFVQDPQSTIIVTRYYSGPGTFSFTEFFYRGATLNFQAKTGLNNKITHYKLDLWFYFDGHLHHKSHTIHLNTPVDQLNVSEVINARDSLWKRFGEYMLYSSSNGTCKLYVYDAQGNVIEKEWTTPIPRTY